MDEGEIFERLERLEEENREIKELAVDETVECLTEYYQKAGLDRYEELAESIKQCSEVY